MMRESTMGRSITVSLVVAAMLLVGAPSAANASFAPGVNYPAGTAPYSIAIGDLNRDAKPDLVVANGVSADVSVLLVMPKTATMAEMRNEVKLKPTGNGMYMGSGNVGMAGKWNTTVMVMKSGKDVGQKKVTLTAK